MATECVIKKASVKFDGDVYLALDGYDYKWSRSFQDAQLFLSKNSAKRVIEKLPQPDRYKAEILEFQSAVTAECIYCGADVSFIGENEVPPAVSDDTAWSRIAEEHQKSCEWVETRAHRLDTKGTR